MKASLIMLILAVPGFAGTDVVHVGAGIPCESFLCC